MRTFFRPFPALYLRLLATLACAAPATAVFAQIDTGDTDTHTQDIDTNNGSGSFVGSGTATYTGVISGAGSYSVDGGGTWTFTRDHVNFSGSIFLNYGTLIVAPGARLSGPTASVDIEGGSTLTFNNTAQTIGALSGNYGTLDLGSGHTLTTDTTADTTLNVYIQGSGALVKTGSGSLSLTATNSYSGGTTLNGGSLTVSSFATLGDSSGALTVNAGLLSINSNQSVGKLSGSGGTIQLGLDSTLTATSSSDSTFAGVIGGDGAFVKDGSGTLTFTGVNDYAGGTSLNNGTLTIDAGASLAHAGGTLTLSNNSTLNLNNDAQTVGRLTGSSGTINLGTGHVLTLTDETPGGMTVPGSGSSFGGLIAGDGSLNITGDLTLSNNANTFAGGTVVRENAVLQLSGDGALGSGALSVRGGTITYQAAFDDLRAFDENTTGVTFNTNGYDVSYGQALGGSLALTKTGDGTLTLTTENTHTGGTTLSQGTLTLASGATLSDPTGNLRVDGGTLNLNDTDQTIGQLYGYGGTIVLGSGATFTTSSSSTDGYYYGSLTGEGSFAKDGTGTLTLSGTNNYTGYTSVIEGVLAFNSPDAIASAGIYKISPGAAAAANYAIDQAFVDRIDNRARGAAALGADSDNPLDFATGGYDTLSLGATGEFTYGGTLTPASDTYRLGGGGGTLTVSGALSGERDLVVGSGSVVLTGVNTQTGNISIVDGGALTVASGATLAGPTAALYMETGTLNLNNAAQTIGTLSGGGSGGEGGSSTGFINLGAGHTLTTNSDGDSTFYGVIAGDGAFTKTGTGTLTLTGNNTYTGNTLVNAGTLNLTGSIAASSLTTVNSSATLSGTGTVGTLTIGDGGILSPGNSPGMLSAGNTTFESGGKLVFEINDAAAGALDAGTSYDLLAISGTLTLTATSANPFTLDLTSLTLLDNTGGLAENFDSAANYSFTFLTTTGGITGFAADKFAIATNHFQNPFNGTWSVALTNTDHDLTLNYAGAAAVPEPSACAIFAGLAALGLAAAKRRRAR